MNFLERIFRRNNNEVIASNRRQRERHDDEYLLRLGDFATYRSRQRERQNENTMQDELSNIPRRTRILQTGLRDDARGSTGFGLSGVTGLSSYSDFPFSRLRNEVLGKDDLEMLKELADLMRDKEFKEAVKIVAKKFRKKPEEFEQQIKKIKETNNRFCRIDIG